jgi:hypothetical protein
MSGQGQIIWQRVTKKLFWKSMRISTTHFIFESALLLKHSTYTPVLDENGVINVRPHTLPEAHNEEGNMQISKLLDKGITAPSRSAFSNLLLLVPKRADGSGKGKVKWRVVINFS